MAIHLALTLALIETLVLSGVLLAWAQRVEGARLLVVFLLGVAIWIVGNELPNWVGPASAPIALRLLATVPLTAAAFLHFSVVFGRLRLPRAVLAGAYAAAVGATLLSVLATPGRFEHVASFQGVAWVVIPNAVGWTTSVVWAGLSGLGVLGLLWCLAHADDALQRRQLAAVALSCIWGLLCMSGFAFAPLRLPWYPWQVLGFPAYPVILVYGILRYRVFVANAWARRALAWTLLLVAGLGVVSLTLLLPVDSRWLSGAVVAATCFALSGPARRAAERLVYPGGTPTASDIAQWRRALGTEADLAALARRAEGLLRERLKLEVTVHIGVGPPATLPTLAPTLACIDGPTGWQTQLLGFDAAPPGPHHLAELFGSVLADAAAQVARAAQAQQQERERQLQARLAELGALAATVAHDLRNPLNIIAMAVATTPAEVRADVSEQVQRISRLAEDLLDYAKPWSLQRAPFDVAHRLQALLRSAPEVQWRAPAEPLVVHADAMRFDQAVHNLLANARSAAGERRVAVEAEQDGADVLVRVCDDGPGVPPEVRDKLFQPFVSRSPGGTGLGLAIVARILQAHGGEAALVDHPPWRTCFQLRFPGPTP